jgi:glycosyltransferase involved in cell wall biosynthesis
MKEQSIQRICLISHYNQYESKRYFAKKFAEALKRAGIEVFHLDLDGGTLTPENLVSIVQFAPNFTCSFNSLLPLKEQSFLCDYLQTPHWSILVDPAMYNTQLINSPYSIISCVDQEDVASITAQNFKNCFFFPHSVEKELVGSGHTDKIYDVVFIGSCYDYESMRTFWQDEHSDAVDQLILNASQMVLDDPSTSIALALCKAWETSGLPQNEMDFYALFYYIDRYTRGKDRVELIRSIKDAKVHVFGEESQDDAATIMGWSHYLSDCKNVELHPPVSYEESLEILKQSKISLNSMPFFKRGSHERVFNALACGALPLTTNTVFWQNNFAEGKELACYRHGQWDEVNHTVNRYLADENLRFNVVAQGAAKVKDLYTWDQRAEQVIQTFPSLLTRV